jgi:methylated-DNA-[protein]-cysteine S-methyltransferase
VLTLHSAFIETPLGTIEITASERGITSLSFVDRPGRSDESQEHLQACKLQLQEYFAGERRTFDALPLALIGTAFSQDVWEQVMRVPFGETATYGQLASLVGREGAARAVGGAVGRNRIAIVIPCHRIVASGSEDSGGYAWGAERKQWLLEHERKARR